MKEIIENMYIDFTEQGEMSQLIEESTELQKVNKYIENIYNQLPPKKKEILCNDLGVSENWLLDELQSNIKEYITSLCDDMIHTYTQKIQKEIEQEEGNIISPIWFLHPEL